MKPLRISGGELRGRTLNSPKNKATHPMGSRERLGLFNALLARTDIEEAEVLDLYAGTGALGIEALSRGAKFATFVEKDHQAVAAIRQNLEELGVASRATVADCAVANFTTEQRFRIIFVDPPYDRFKAEDFQMVGELLEEHGVVIVSHPEGVEFELTGLKLVSNRAYAAARIAIFRKG